MKKEKTIWKNLNETKTIGKLKSRKSQHKFLNKREFVGCFKVELLREYLRLLKKDDLVGVYINKKTHEVEPLHCRGICLAPRTSNWPGDKTKEMYGV